MSLHHGCGLQSVNVKELVIVILQLVLLSRGDGITCIVLCVVLDIEQIDNVQ